MEKKFIIASHELKKLIATEIGFIASDMITVNGDCVKYMYRDEPTDAYDSG